MIINNTDSSNINLTISQLMQAPFVTGSLIVNFSQNKVTLNNDELVLQPKVLELLVILCAANGETLSKQILIKMLWPDTIVGPDSLANTMTRLRKTLNDDAKNPIFIKTVQRKGYLWLPEVLKIKRDKKFLCLKNLVLAISVFTGAALLFMLESPKPESFPFPDLSIQKLNGGGYEIQVGIEGELTKEKEAAMLAELKRITGEENSSMEFTIDEINPECTQKAVDANNGINENIRCKNSKK